MKWTAIAIGALVLFSALPAHATAATSLPSAGPGNWVVGYHHAESAACDFSGTVRVTASTPPGVPLALFMAEPSPTSIGFHAINGFPFLLESPNGGARSLNFTFGWSGSACDGIAYAFGTNGALSVNVTVRDSHGDVPASFLAQGTGTSYEHAEPTAIAPGVGSVELDAPVTQGWTHIQVGTSWDRIATACALSGVRVEDIHFPNESPFFGAPQGPRAVTQVGGAIGLPRFPCGIGAWTTNYTFARGEQNDTAGTMRAKITYAETSQGVALSLLHMPMGPDAFPPGFERWGYLVE